MPLFDRCASNPILTVDHMPLPAEAVFNPGATEHDGQVVLLLRIERSCGYSSIHVARSANGVDGWTVELEPILDYGLPDMRYEQWGCEDARVVYLDPPGSYHITYTAYSPAGAAVGLARTDDFTDVDRIGLIFSPNNKDAALFCQRFGQRWAALHRPDAGGGIENIWIAFSPDLIHWGEPHCVLREGHGPAWDAVKVGVGPPPLWTEHGWLLLYHGVKAYAGELVYRVGAALLDLDQPHKVVARTDGCIFKPREMYEMSGLVPNVVFPSGMLLRGDELWVYYGASDTVVGLATVKLNRILAALEVPGTGASETGGCSPPD